EIGLVKGEIGLYDLCGYLLKTRSSVLGCPNCKSLLQTSEMELPADFAAADYTLARTHGGLKLVSVAMFRIFRVVENVIQHFKSASHVYVRHSYQECISKICLCNVMSVSCEDHLDILHFLNMEHLQICF
ncbi:Cell division ftsj-like protein, partial [Daphnia magna]